MPDMGSLQVDLDALKRQARVLKALASEPRLRIISRLEKGPQCVCELTELLGSDQSTVSRHIGVLRAAGLVAGRRSGQHIYYRLVAPSVLPLLECAVRVTEEREASSEPRE